MTGVTVNDVLVLHTDVESVVEATYTLLTAAEGSHDY